LVGDTVNLSQRLQQLASSGETVLSEATVQAMTCEVSTVKLDEQLVKGRDTPVVAYKVLSFVHVAPGFDSKVHHHAANKREDT
jgi:class 3 adenylate cyclase